jgi:hypothetical protein
MAKKLLLIMLILGLIGCGEKAAKNPLDPRNETFISDSLSGFNVTRGVDASSEEGKEIVNFKWGEHIGELKCLEISITYLDYFFVDENGYPVYFIEYPMRYQIRIKNNSNRSFEHLEVIAIQEYYENMVCQRWWYPYPLEVVVHKGDPMPGESIQVWQDVYLGPYSEVVLEDTYTAPIQTCAGLDQTHIIIKHYNNNVVTAALIYDNPELGIYCPPAPEK